MSWTRRSFLTLTTLAITALTLPSHAGPREAPPPPEWVRPALRYLVDQGYLEREDFHANQSMTRAAFKALMGSAFGGGYRREKGNVTAGEVAAALVRRLGKGSIADALGRVKSPDGWTPGVPSRFGSEVVARELGLRRDRSTSEERFEASAHQPMRQGDVAYAVWKAKTAPSLYSAEALKDFALVDYTETQRKVVEFALSMVGTPYVWGGEWPAATPAGYPYGAQPAGGVDCSGFIWYVLQKKTPSYQPVDRPYEGWSIPERASYQMAAAVPKAKRLGRKELRPADIVFFAPAGRDAKASSVYHAGLYLGDGWMVHSSGSRAGISLAQIGPGSWWNDQIAWGRRVIHK
jgi:cell wall-associated NlpC family hydrolase